MALASILGPAVESASGGLAEGMLAGGTPLGWLEAASPLLGAAMTPGAPAGPSRADATQVGSGSTFNNSGWTVATGKASATATPPLNLPWLYILIAGVVGLLVWKRA